MAAGAPAASMPRRAAPASRCAQVRAAARAGAARSAAEALRPLTRAERAARRQDGGPEEPLFYMARPACPLPAAHLTLSLPWACCERLGVQSATAIQLFIAACWLGCWR